MTAAEKKPTRRSHRRSLATAGSKVRAAASLLARSGWDEATIQPPVQIGGVTVLRVAPAGEPRLSVVLGRRETPALPASLAYSSESQFLIHWGSSAISLSQPNRWSARPGDSPGIVGDSSDSWALEDIFSLGGPEKLLGGEARLVSMIGQSHETLAIRLGNALAELRRWVAEIGAEGEQDLDQPLLRFFHQMLFVRVQEDRGEVNGARVAELYRDVDDDQLVVEVDHLLNRYRATLNSELFEPTGLPLETIGAAALRPLLKSLVAPWQELELNFSLSRADLAGRLYQQYMKQTPAIERAGEGRQPRLLSVAVQRDQQESTAAYYTPMAVASVLAADTLGSWLSKRRPSRPDQVRLIDPACGSGSFLVAGFEQIRTHLEAGGRSLRRSQREAILRESIFGADIDPKAIDITKVQLLEAAELSRHRLPDLDANLFVGDSLARPLGPRPGVADQTAPASSQDVPWSQIIERVGAFDAVLMNPPFGAQLRLSERYDADHRTALRERFPEVRSWGSDLAYYFVSLAFSLMGRGACGGMIVPRKILAGTSAARTREYIASLSQPARIVDFRGLGLFPGALPYIAMLEFLPNARTTELVDVVDSTVDSALVLDSMLEGQNHIIRRSRTPRARLADPWTPFSLRLRDALSGELGCEWRPLGDVEEIVVRQGTQTGAQRDFTISETRWQEEQSGLLIIDGHRLKPTFAPFVAWARDIVPMLPPARRERLFFPFDENGKTTADSGALALLDALGGFHGRPQPGPVTSLRAPKVILRGFGVEPAAFADPNAEWITVKGTVGGLIFTPATAQSPDVLQAIAGLLNSSLFQWALRGLGQPRHDESVEILQADAELLPWPDLSTQAWMQISAAAKAVIESAAGEPGAHRALAYRHARKRLDELVIELLEVGPRLQETISVELVRAL